MKAVKIVGQEKIEVVETPVPEVGPNDALVRLKATALCRSDLYRYHGTTCFDDDSANTNFTPGHEPCGIVEKVGDKVTNVKPGDRVGLFMFVGCGECEYCLRGDEMLCKQFGCIGFQRDGAHADYIVLPGANCLKIPDEMSFVAASLLTDVGGGLYTACRNLDVKGGKYVVIVGAGPIGLFHLQLSKIAGARKVIVSEPNEQRRKVALELGADLVVDPTKEELPAIVNRETNGQGMDVIVMAIGVPALVNSTLKLCKRGGTVNLFAGFAGTGESTIEVNTIHYNEINVNGSTAYKLEDYLAAAEMIKSGKIDADKIVTHRFKIEDFQKAYDVCVAGTGLKVIIEP